MTGTPLDACLVLCPDDPHWIPGNPENIINCLRHRELISDEIINTSHDMSRCFLAGEKFLDLITFMGCSPNINLSPSDVSEKFSFIGLETTPDAITALTSRHTQAPHCPACNKAEKDWRQKLTSTELQCASCGQSSPPWLYNWRKSAGFGRTFIRITEIYPKEAIPQQALLDHLRDELGAGWQYFYYFS
jgi:hypothetical protein